MKTLIQSPSRTRICPVIMAGLAVLLARQAQADYQSSVLADHPQAYYRFNDSTTRNLLNLNSGSLGAAGNASNDLAFVTGGIVHPMPGAIIGESDQAEFFDYTARAEIPFNSAINTPNTQPFTVESWIYPVSDQASTGMGVWCNRYTQGSTRQGWVMYQRGANTNVSGFTSGPGVGWEFRMYNNQDTSGHLDVTSGVPFTFGKWQHVVVVYDPVQVTNATLTIYIDGTPANTNIWAATDGVTPGYYPCQNTNAVQPNGPPAMSLGGYNNANGGNYGFENPWTGGIDEFAWYNAKLTPAQILGHYQNGTNANRTQSYSALIRSNNPVVYLRLDDRAPGPDEAVNFGDLRGSATGTNTLDVRHPAFSALAGRTTGGAAAYHQRNGSSTTDIPWVADNNPAAGVPFTFETWLRPTSDRQNPGAAPVNNRYVSSGNRTGWVIFQRAPNTNYAPGISGYSGVGWNFRMYSGLGSGGQDVLTGVPYTIGHWQHLAVTWQPTTDNGTLTSGNDQWAGVLTAFVNGVAVASNTAALYAANVSPTEDSTAPADLAIGSYNAASGLGSNPYEGDIDHLAFYNNSVLTPEQILAHYQAGTNSMYGTNYESLVFNAGGDLYLTNSGPPIPEGKTIPKTYLTFNDPARLPATNSGTIGFVADGNLVNNTNGLAGPQPPTYLGFEASNTALALNGTNGWASFNNPSGLNISGQITLEAWVKPASSQEPVARIISHGPQTISSYEAFVGTVDPAGSDFLGATTNTSEVFLRMEGHGANYAVGSSQYDDGTGTNTTYEATFPVPAGDLGSSDWIYLVGAYDGTTWKLYRNGTLVATQASPTGGLAVDLGDWAVGSTGEGWADNFYGAVDEVAIYNTALSASQVSAHYLAAKNGTTPSFTIVPAGNHSITITWPAGAILQQSSTVNGTYTNVPGSPVSPLTIPASGAMFYRWKM